MNPRDYARFQKGRLLSQILVVFLFFIWIELSQDQTPTSCTQQWSRVVPYIDQNYELLCSKQSTIIPIFLYYIVGTVIVFGFTAYEVFKVRNYIQLGNMGWSPLAFGLLYIYSIYAWYYDFNGMRFVSRFPLHEGGSFALLFYYFVHNFFPIFIVTGLAPSRLEHPHN